MKKYFFKSNDVEQGPFTIEELISKNLPPETLVRHEDAVEWFAINSLNEFQTQITSQINVATPPISSSTASSTTNASTPVEKQTTATATNSKKKTASISWIILLMALGGIGYFVYQNLVQGKSGTVSTDAKADSAALNNYLQETAGQNNAEKDMTASDSSSSMPQSDLSEKNAETNTAISEKPADKNKNTPGNTKTTANTTKQKTESLTAKQKQEQEEAKKKQQAAEAAAMAKAKEYRNGWSKYLTLGNMDIHSNGDEGIAPFVIPVSNKTNATIEKMVLRVDYWKKDKKVVGSENVTLYNIPAFSVMNGNAAGYKKGTKAKVIITNIIARKINFCYPGSSFTPDDPFYCK